MLPVREADSEQSNGAFVMNGITDSCIGVTPPLKRVCIVSHSAGLAGAELVLLELVRVLLDADVACTVILPKHGHLERRLAAMHVPTKVTPYRWWVGTRSRFLRLLRLPSHFLAAWKLSRLPELKTSDAIV